MNKNRFSLILTVFNEEHTIRRLINSFSKQSKTPDEIIIVDGGSNDNTLSIIQNSKFKIKNIRVKIITRKGNRSVGRNEAIKKATGNIILCTDSGCTLENKWVEYISKPFENKDVKVVAGYYKGIYKNMFQKSLNTYVLVMEDNIKKEFLPSTRSMAFRKSVWKKIGGFDETLSHNEDYEFARKIKKSGINIFFERKAVVEWMPRENLKEAFIMFFRFALGDAEAKIFRPKVILIFLRYLVFICLVLIAFKTNSSILYIILILLFLSPH
ncbi:MAG: glycosyltransferase, partial [Patescibacteria group bacterium]|nr:glycosyltransferase [Patescibacteria group bacterium]